jgi:predicted NBD/HSP70 family sugar kinase
MAGSVSKKIAQTADRDLSERVPFGFHGAAQLPLVDVENYNIEFREHRRFIGDKANKQALFDLVRKHRRLAQKNGKDPFGDLPDDDIGKTVVTHVLRKGGRAARAVVHAAVDEFAERLVQVVRRFLKLPEWKKVERIVVGGGTRSGRLGEFIIGRAQHILNKKKIRIDLRPIRSDPDEAGLLGAAYLVPSWVLAGYEGILAIDIGGTNFRAGVVELKIKKSRSLVRARVQQSVIWEYADEEPDRAEAVDELTKMLRRMVREARRAKIRLAPFIGIGCPGRIRIDGAIDRGAQNLPGNWEADRFNLPLRLQQDVRIVRGLETVVLMHNDAVVQGLSELPRMQDVTDWAILTIGTGLGNAKFTNRWPRRERKN